MITGLIKIHFKFLIITPPQLFKQRTNYTASKKRTFTLSRIITESSVSVSTLKSSSYNQRCCLQCKQHFLFLNSPECRIQSVSASYDQHSSVSAMRWLIWTPLTCQNQQNRVIGYNAKCCKNSWKEMHHAQI